MKKLMKNNLKLIIGFILGIVVSGIGVYAAGLSFASGDVEHTKANGTKTTVEAAVNELYSIHNSGNAAANQILAGKTAFANGSLLTGTMNDYSSSTGLTCTKANTSNKLYVKPVNSGYYTANSSFNTGINYNPKGTGGTASTTGTTVTSTSTNVTLNGSDLTLDNGSKITIPAGYYSNAINVSNGGTSSGTLRGYAVWLGSYYAFILDLESGKSVRGNTGTYVMNGITFTISSYTNVSSNKNGKLYKPASLPVNTLNDCIEVTYTAGSNIIADTEMAFYVPLES